MHNSVNMWNCTVPYTSGFVLSTHSTGKHLPSLYHILYFSLSFPLFSYPFAILHKYSRKFNFCWFLIPTLAFSYFVISRLLNLTPIHTKCLLEIVYQRKNDKNTRRNIETVWIVLQSIFKHLHLSNIIIAKIITQCCLWLHHLPW